MRTENVCFKDQKRKRSSRIRSKRKICDVDRYDTMHKNGPPPPYEPPPYAPPAYSQNVGGVPPASPFTPAQTYANGPTIVTTIVPLGPQPTHTICPHCHAEIDTTTKTEPGMIAYISGVIIALLGCWFGCCLIPCCIDECMDVHHTCPNCKAYLGRHRR